VQKNIATALDSMTLAQLVNTAPPLTAKEKQRA
jgi:hypothetical protein